MLTPAAWALLWHDYDETYIVYQPSSAETHVFNETTALILRSLEQGPLSTQEAREWTEAALGVEPGELVSDDFAFATQRLEELGLIEWFDETAATQ